MRLEVLCTTMNQKNINNKYRKMNIQSDVVFSNQDDRHEYIEECIDGNNVKMITTPYRGVGKNRNLGILYSSADILLFSDDDMVYVDGYKNKIIDAFKSIPNADIIIFNIGSEKLNTSRRINTKPKKVNMLNVLNYGMPRIAIRRTSLEKSNICVSNLFGGGARYCGGEDNLFLVTALKKGLKIYTHPFKIGDLIHRESTWFNGFNRKYFFDNGAWLEATFPIMKYILLWYFVFRFRNKTDISMKDIIYLQYEGIKAYKKGKIYEK